MAGRDLGSFGEAAADLEAGDAPDTFTFYGEVFTVARRVGAIPLMRFAHAARSGIGTGDIDGLSAMYDMIRDCLADAAEFERFESVAVENKADGDVILTVCQAVYEAIAGRPTRPRSSSSAGRRSTSRSSAPKSTRTRASGSRTAKATPRKATKAAAATVDFGAPVAELDPARLRKRGTG